ncbi:hypothetical protein CBR_g8415 [Chara braunii]|uniref:Integrase zinc-binding domain-containing protein n=1 Tax=Chara braunii TaxID=69332 RepID=A0A388KM47_CHABU|nr:hypothetical protein CBR_g8415 [Chara braunii]|eukprot:GBG71117.1 hypothetical protein CBR_g8415 [Chara braunii]
MPKGGSISDGAGRVLTLEDFIAALDRHEKTPSNVPKVETFHFNVDWLDLVEQAMVGLLDEVKFQRIMRYVLHGHHQEVQKVVDAANDSWARFRESMLRKYRLEAAKLTSHRGGSAKLTWATIDRGVEDGSLDQVEQHQMRLQRRKRKKRDATASGTPGVKRIVADVLAALGYDGQDAEAQEKVVVVVQGRGKEVGDEGAGQEDYGGEETGSQILTKAQRKQRNLLLGGQGSGKGQIPQAVAASPTAAVTVPISAGPASIGPPPACGHWVPYCQAAPWPSCSHCASCGGGQAHTGQMVPFSGPSTSAGPPSFSATQGQFAAQPPPSQQALQASVGWRVNLPKVFLYETAPGPAAGQQSSPGVAVAGSGPRSGMTFRSPTPHGRAPQATQTKSQSKAGPSQTPSQAPPRKRPEPERRKKVVEVQEKEEEEEDTEDERFRQEEDRQTEQRAQRREAQERAEPGLQEGLPRKRKYTVRLEEDFDVERMVDRLLEGHNDLMNLKDILASAPRLREELKGRLSRRLVPNVYLSIVLPREVGCTQAGTRMDWKCVACGLVDLVVKEKKCVAMMDTGAEMNIIRERDALMLGMEIDRADHSMLHGANCKAVFCGTALNVIIEIGKVRARTCFFVMPDVDYPILLGKSFMYKHDGTMILLMSDPACENYEVVTCRNTGPGSEWNRPNPGSFTYVESENERRRLWEEPEEEDGAEVLSLSLTDLMKKRHRAYAFNDDQRGRLDVDKIPMIWIHTVPHEPWNLRGARYPNPDEEKMVVGYLDGKMRTHAAGYSSGPYASPWFCFIKSNGTLRGYERKADLVLKPFQEEDLWGGKDTQWMMKLTLACTHSLVEEVRMIGEGPTQVEEHEQLMGGMYLLTNTLLQGDFDQRGSFSNEDNEILIPESQDAEFEEGEIKEAFRAKEYDGIYRELGLLLSCEMRDRDASAKAQKMRHLYVVRDGHLFIKRQVGNPKRIICGRNRQIDIIAALHDGIAGGHRGIGATCTKISKLYHWDGMLTMVIKYCQSCVPCQERSAQRSGEPLHPRLEREVGEVVHLDLLFMPVGENGCNYIFDARDNLTGFVDGRAIRTKTGPVLANCIEEYYLRYPFVKEFVMDQGSEFTCNEREHAAQRGWDVSERVRHLRGIGKFEEPIAQIREEALTWSEVEARMQRLRASPLGNDGLPIRLEEGNVEEFIPAYKQYMSDQGVPRDEWVQALLIWTRGAERPLARQIRGRARDWEDCRAQLREAFRRPGPKRPEPKVDRRRRSKRLRDLEARESVASRGDRKALAQREEEQAGPTRARESFPACGLRQVEFHPVMEGDLPGSSPRAPGRRESEVPAAPFRGLEAHLDASQWEASSTGVSPMDPSGEERIFPELEAEPLRLKGLGAEDVIVEIEARGPEEGWRIEPRLVIDSCLASHAAEHPDIEGPSLVGPSSGPACTELGEGSQVATGEVTEAGIGKEPDEAAQFKRAKVRARLAEIYERRDMMEAAGIASTPPVDPKTSEQRIDELWARYEGWREAARQRAQETGLATEGADEAIEIGELGFSAARKVIEWVDKEIKQTSITAFQRYSLLSDELALRKGEVEQLTAQLAEERLENKVWQARLEAKEAEWEAKLKEMAAAVERLAATKVIDWTEQNRYGIQGEGVQGLFGQEEEAEASRQEKLGKVFLDPAEAEARKEASKGSFEFKAPTELASQQEAPTSADTPIEALTQEPLPAPVEEGAAEESLLILLDVQEGTLTGAVEPPQLEAQGKEPSRLDELVAAMKLDMPPEEPQEQRTPEHEPEMGKLRAQLGSWATGTDSGGPTTDQRQQEATSQPTRVATPQTPRPRESEEAAMAEETREGRPLRLDTPEYQPEGEMQRGESSAQGTEGGAEGPWRLPQSHEASKEKEEAPPSLGAQRKKNKFQRKSKAMCFYFLDGVHRALECPKFLKDKAEGRVNEQDGKMYDRQGRVVERAPDGGRALLYRQNQEEMSELGLVCLYASRVNRGCGGQEGRGARTRFIARSLRRSRRGSSSDGRVNESWRDIVPGTFNSENSSAKEVELRT